MAKLYRLTDQQIGDAIVQYIGIFMEGKGFFPYRIISAVKSPTNPPTTLYELEYNPKGTTIEEAKHAL